MKNFSFSHVVILLFAFSKLSASGVVIANAYEGIYFMQISSIDEVTVNNQIAIVKTTQTFRNNTGGDIAVKYGFPMHESASAVKLRWNTYEGWFTASISGDSQDTLQGNNGNGQPIDPSLEQYLGEFPLLFSPDGVILKDSIITVELTYVELLPYKFSVVNFNYPNNYGMISNDIISGEQSFSLSLTH
jgi:hypothetical protein